MLSFFFFIRIIFFLFYFIFYFYFFLAFKHRSQNRHAGITMLFSHVICWQFTMLWTFWSYTFANYVKFHLNLSKIKTNLNRNITIFKDCLLTLEPRQKSKKSFLSNQSFSIVVSTMKNLGFFFFFFFLPFFTYIFFTVFYSKCFTIKWLNKVN